MKNTESYFLIDKEIISQNNSITFDLYSHNNESERLFLIYNKSSVISPHEIEKLLSYNKIYAELKNKTIYTDFYLSSTKEIVIPKDMEGFYSNISENINELFNNPESLSNAQKAKEVVGDMIDIIIKDDFTVSSFITILSYDYYTHTHSLNVSVYALCLGKEMGMDKDTLIKLGTSALLHDLGKSKIDNVIINKNGALTEKEFFEVKKHPFYGWLLAKKLGILDKDILCGILHHHEKIDGSGYPKGLKDEEIPLFARIISVCDAFDAITTRRSYKDPVSTYNTLILMKTEMSNNFDVKIINNFIKMLKG